MQAGKEFGCVIFAHSSVNGELTGTYTASSMERGVSLCETKPDYVFTQFKNAEGRRVFRLQCELPVFEDQLPQPFAPDLENAKKIRFFQEDEDQKTVRVEKAG